MKVITASGLVASLLLVSLILGTPNEQSFGAKPPPLPPIRYRIQFWTSPNPANGPVPQSMNNFGQVVGAYEDTDGEYRGYLYDPTIDPDTALDVEDLINGAGVPAGRKIRTAGAINRYGVLVGSLAMIGFDNIRQAFALDLNAQTPTVVPLPVGGDSMRVHASGINDSGDIVGIVQDPDDGSFSIFFYNPNIPATPLYLPGAGSTAVAGGCFLNNQAQVGGALNDGSFTPFRWTPLSGALQVFTGLSNEAILGMNNSGMMCGYSDVTTTTGSGKKTSTTTQRLPMRLSSLPANILAAGGAGNHARGINSTADVVISNGTLYRDDWSAYGNYVDINKLVVGTPADLSIWNAASTKFWWCMNDRIPPAGGGQIMGTLIVNGVSLNFTLNPIPAP